MMQCATPTVLRGHMNSCMVFISRTIQGRVPIPHTLHGRALKHKEPLIMRSMQIACLVAHALVVVVAEDMVHIWPCTVTVIRSGSKY